MQIVSKAQNLRFSARLIANLHFPKEQTRENDRHAVLEHDSPGLLPASRLDVTPPVSNAHTSAPERKQRSHRAPQTLPLRPAEMVSMRTQDLERPASPDKTKAVLTKLNQNSDRADCQTLELVTPGLGLPYSGKRLQ